MSGQSIDGEALRKISTEVSGAFSVASFELDTIRTSANELQSEVKTLLGAATQENDDASDRAFLENSASAAEAARGAAESLTDRVFQKALVSVTGSLREMQKVSVELSSVSTLAKISQSEEGEMHERLMAFTQALSSRSSQLRETASTSLELIAEIQRGSSMSRDHLVAIESQFRGILEAWDGQTHRLSELETGHRNHMEATRDNASILGEGVTRAVGELIGCLQFPDAFSQRTEHVMAAIDAMAEAPKEERAALAAVTAAHLDAMAETLSAVTSKADRGLTTLDSTLDRNPVIRAQADALDPSDAWMDASTRVNRMRVQSIELARDKLGAAFEVLSGLIGQIDAARANLEVAVRFNRELEISVHNAAIVAGRSGNPHSPLRFLARAVEEIVGRSLKLIHNLDESLTTIRRTSEALGQTSLERDLNALITIQDEAAATDARQKESVELIRTSRQNLLSHANRLHGASTAGGNAFQAAREHTEGLCALARRIRDGAPETDLAGVDLKWLFDSYTMDEERGTHREILGDMPGMPAEDEEDELDDFLL